MTTVQLGACAALTVSFPSGVRRKATATKWCVLDSSGELCKTVQMKFVTRNKVINLAYYGRVKRYYCFHGLACCCEDSCCPRSSDAFYTLQLSMNTDSWSSEESIYMRRIHGRLGWLSISQLV